MPVPQADRNVGPAGGVVGLFTGGLSLPVFGYPFCVSPPRVGGALFSKATGFVPDFAFLLGAMGVCVPE